MCSVVLICELDVDAYCYLVIAWYRHNVRGESRKKFLKELGSSTFSKG